MDTHHLLDSLNAPQKEAVSAGQENMLVLAGAGSGKTRVLVHRIAWLMEQEGISPFEILAVTFTNKAAHEMRGRIESLRGTPMAAMWVGTFHGLAHRLLRMHWEEAKLPQAFQILDSDDQFRLIRRVHKNLNLDETKWAPKQSQWFINKSKEQGLRPSQIKDTGFNYFNETMQKVYAAYQDVCERSGLVDFTELLLRSLELLKNNEDIRAHYQKRFRHILVDEFQDTNTIQYEWLSILATSERSFIMAVGDDDQSIYSWRGAKVENIQKFTKDFKPVKTIRLEQNYRSTETILSAANAVIENNENRMGKKLWTEDRAGEPITLYSAFNERDEAHYIVNGIRDWCAQQDNQPRDVAILYRSNAQSRILEERLIDAHIAYRIYGGLKFFERAEIKDALGYFRLLANRNDDAAFERIVNMPTRGIGNTTLMRIRDTARENGASLWQSAAHLIEQKALNGRASNALNNFMTLINSIADETKNTDLGETCEIILHRSTLLSHYQNDKSEKGLSRVENLEELINATTQFKPEETDEALDPLSAFLAHVALETGDAQSEPNSNCVNLMTLHSAKGLEFPVVFIAGMEEDLFPHKMSTEEPNGLEEERRLCYVGMTRAMKKLYLTHAESRRLHGMEKFNGPSRFLHEIPEEYLHTVRPAVKVTRPSSTYGTDNSQFYVNNKSYNPKTATRPLQKGTSAGGTGMNIGERVNHKKFGKGVILNYEGQGEHARVQVKFERVGAKWLVASFAKLQRL